MVSPMAAVLLAGLAVTPVAARAKMEKRAVVHVRSDQESVLNQANLQEIKRYILQSGQTRTYSQKYSHNPFFSTDAYFFYLNPDPGGPVGHPQWNIGCDPKIGDFHTLVIQKTEKTRSTADFPGQYLHVFFLHENDIQITSDALRAPALKVRESAEHAVEELLGLIEKAEGRSKR